MCRAKNDIDARRCSGCLHDLMTANRAELIAVSEKKEFLEAQLSAGHSSESIQEQLTKVILREEQLKETIATRQAAYNATPRGLDELEERVNDDSLSETERQKAKSDLEAAQAAVVARSEERVKAYNHQDGFRAFMTEHGVSQDKIDEVMKLKASDTGSPWTRSFSRYKSALETARKNVAEEKARYKAKVMEIEGRGLSYASERDALSRAKRQHDEKLKKLHRINREAKLRYDSAIYSARESVENEDARYQEEVLSINERGLPKDTEREALSAAKAKHRKNRRALLVRHEEALAAENVERKALQRKMDQLDSERNDALEAGNRQLAAACTLERAEEMAKKEARDRRVERVLNTRRSDRNARDLIKRRINEMADEAGIDRKAAQAAWVNPPEHTVRPSLRARSVDIHVTSADLESLEDSYRGTDAFKEHGEDGFNPWVIQRLMASPSTKLDGRSVEDMQVSAELFKTINHHGRQWTSKAGKRSTRVRPILSDADRKTIAMRAEACHMDKSSYMRAMAIDGGNPWLIQNDRSPKHHREKIAKIREVIGEFAEPAKA